MKLGVIKLNRMIELSKEYKALGKRVVVYNGGFDILHIGHVSAIKEAKSKGDVLFILVNSDKSIRSYKGQGRPFIPQRYRADLVSVIQGVDAVAIFDEITPVKALEKLKPTIYCSGSDWGKNCIERYTVEKFGGQVHVLKKVSGFSTTDLVKKIQSAFSIPTIRAIFLESGIQSGANSGSGEYKIITLPKKSVEIKFLIDFASQQGIDLCRSWIVSTSAEDIIVGRNINLKTIKIGKQMPREIKLHPNYYAVNYSKALQIILN